MTSAPAAVTADIPHPQAAALHAQFRNIDLTGCNVFVVATGMTEFDRNKRETFTLSVESWPPEVRAIVAREIDAFRNAAKGAIAAMTTSLSGDVFTVALHWRPKA